MKKKRERPDPCPKLDEKTRAYIEKVVSIQKDLEAMDG